MNISEGIDQCRTDRVTFLENPNFRRWSDIVSITDREYECIPEYGMLVMYINGGTYKNGHLPEHARFLVERHINDPEINWEGLYDYLDKRKSRELHTLLRCELTTLASILEPYRDRILTSSTFIGY